MKKIAAIVMMLSLIAIPAYADWNEQADNGDYFQKVPGMIGRGFVNFITCPGYFIEDTCNGTKEKDFLGGTTNGMVTGLGKTLAAGAGGLWDMATAVVPEYRGAGYKRGMWPNYEWETPTDTTSTTSTAEAK